jgi:hypothetical protein
MNNPTVRPDYKRLMPVCLLVLCALLGAGAHPTGALAADVPNPDPGLIVRWEPCEPNTGVTVIVDDHTLGEGKVYVGCALGEQPNGVDALEHAGFALEGTATYGLAFICRIDGEPTPAEQACTSTPGAGAYWSYWRGKPGGRWGYSGVGAASPNSRSPINSVEGWGFGSRGAPRIEPMDGGGPSSFSLPPEQEGSVIPARLAREWLVPTLSETAVRTEEDELGKREELGSLRTFLRGTVALVQAGVAPAELAPIAHWLSRTCEENGVSLGSCVLRGFAEPKAPSEDQYAGRYAAAILSLQALGENPSSFDGEDLRGTLEGLIEEATGKVENGGQPSQAIVYLAPTVLALARTGVLPAKALKTVDLLLAQQETGTGSFELETNVDVEAVEALVAAREKGAAVLESSRMNAIEAALTKAGENLERLQEPDGGVRAEGRYEETEPEPEPGEAEPTIESTALGVIGLALTGHGTAAERAAKWLTRYQITAEYAGRGNPETGEHTPAEALIGAFTEGEGALKEALVYGIPSSEHYGVYGEAQAPTIDALAALTAAGAYGPYDASFDQQSLLFESRTLGSPSKSLIATLTNEDVRPVTIATVGITGEQAGDFQLAGGNCVGHTLPPGQSCEAQVNFDPTTLGLHEAILQATVQGTSQPMYVPLTGTGTPAPEPGPQPKAEPSPGPAVSPITSSTATPGPSTESTTESIVALAATQRVSRTREAQVARLNCPPGHRCTVKAPRAVRVLIAGKRYSVTVIAPHELNATGHATIRVRLSKQAYSALAGRTITVTMAVTIQIAGRSRTRLVKVRITRKA